MNPISIPIEDISLHLNSNLINFNTDSISLEFLQNYSWIQFFTLKEEGDDNFVPRTPEVPEKTSSNLGYNDPF